MKKARSKLNVGTCTGMISPSLAFSSFLAAASITYICVKKDPCVNIIVLYCIITVIVREDTTPRKVYYYDVKLFVWQ
jgi:hypothetical protein